MTYINVTIDDVQIYSVSIPLKSRIKMAGVSLDTADNVIIKIVGHNSLVGWGGSIICSDHDWGIC